MLPLDKSTTTLAEQALLGALLWEPRRLPGIAEHLEPAQLHQPTHQAIYTALMSVAGNPDGPLGDVLGHPPGYEPDPSRLTPWVRAVHDHARAHTQVRGLTPTDLTDLMARCPHPAHAGAYLRLVLEEHARRVVVAVAARTRQALQMETPDLEPASTAWAKAVDRLTRSQQAPARPARRAYERAVQDQLATPATVAPAVAQRETAVLGSLLAAPAGFDRVASWLDPADFAQPAARAIYESMLALRQRSQPVDPITTAAEATRRGAIGGPGQYSPWDLLRLANTASVADLYTQAAALQEDGARRRLLAGAIAIEHAAANPRTRADQLVGLTSEHVARARAEHARLNRASAHLQAEAATRGRTGAGGPLAAETSPARIHKL